MLQRQPGGILLVAADALLDEVHAFDTVVDIRIDRVTLLDRFALGTLGHLVKGGRVDIRERFKEGFGVTAGNRQAAAPDAFMNAALGSRV